MGRITAPTLKKSKSRHPGGGKSCLSGSGIAHFPPKVLPLHHTVLFYEECLDMMLLFEIYHEYIIFTYTRKLLPAQSDYLKSYSHRRTT